MDELPSDESFNSNGVVDKEEATDNIIATNGSMVKELQTSANMLDTNLWLIKGFLQAIKKEKSNEISSEVQSKVTRTLHFQKKINSSDTCDGFLVPIDLQTDEASVYSRTEYFTLSREKEICLHYTVDSPSCSLNKQFKPLMRKNATQREIAFDRECKKLEAVWASRGLPVDKQTIRSAANKDAFDMSDLSDSLPSTSATERKLNGFKRTRRMYHHRPISHSQLGHTIAYLHSQREKRFEISPSSLKDSIISTPQRHTCWPRATSEDKSSLSRWEMSHSLGIKTVIQSLFKDHDEQKEASGMNEKGIKNWSHKDQEATGHHSMCPEFEKMCLEDQQEGKREERQNSVVENNQEHCFPPLSKLSQNAIQCCSWGSERNWSTDFQTPDLHVPANSPVKNEENANRNDPVQALFDSRKQLLEIRRKSLQLLRANCKLRTLNSHRGVCSEDMNDGSKTENPSSEEALNQKIIAAREHVETLCANQLKLSRLMCKQMLIKLRESVKNSRCFPNRLSGSIVKSDKVVPD